MVSRLWVAAVARLDVSSTSCSTAWTDSFPASAVPLPLSVFPPVLAVDEPWSAVELPPDFPFLPLPFALGGALVAVEAELPEAAVPDDALASVVPDGGAEPASAGGGVDASAGFVESGAALPAGVPEFGFGLALVASAGGVGVWVEF